MAYTEDMTVQRPRLKLTAYERIYSVRHRLTPSAERSGRQGPTWCQWFENKFGEPIENYHQRVQARKKENAIQAQRDAQIKFMQSAKGSA